MRLIDADKLKQDVLEWEDCPNGYSDTYDKARIIDEIDEAPTIDAEPRERGCWLPYEFGDYHWHKCSVCGVADKYIETINNIEIKSMRHFCPMCGARMEEK